MKIEPEQIQALTTKLGKHSWVKSADVGGLSTDLVFTEKGLAGMNEIVEVLVAPQVEAGDEWKGGISVVKRVVGLCRLLGELGLSSDDEIHAFNGLVQSW